MSAALDEIRQEVLRLLAAKAGMAAESIGAAAITYAVRKRLAACGAAREQNFARRLSDDPEEFQELLEELVVPETWFFRDAQPLRFLARRFADDTVRRERVLRVLCAGCSTGEEVYSVAVTLREAGLTPAEFRIVGTDISRRSLELARNGKYSARSFRERDEAIGALCRVWFEQTGQSWQVRDTLRAGVEFISGNLSRPDFLAGELAFDAIFCRNVLIYFHDESRSVAVRRLQELLRPDGLLFSAPAEARIFSEAGFRSIGGECTCAFRCPGPAARVQNADRVPPIASQPARRIEPISRPSSFIPHPIPATAMLSEGIASGTEDAPSQSALHVAERAADEGRLEEADALCGQVLSREPASAAAHYLRGMVRQAQGALGEAQRSLEKALYLDPKHFQALVHMTLLAEQRGDQRAAENYRRRAQEVVAEEA